MITNMSNGNNINDQQKLIDEQKSNNREKYIQNNKYVNNMIMSQVLNSSSHNNNSSNHQITNSVMAPSSLSTDEYSSRYSSLQETESLKSAILDSFRMHWIQAWSIMECKILNDITIDDLSSIINHLQQMISLLIEENVTEIRTASLTDLKNEHISASTDSGHIANSTINPLLEFLSTECILEKIFQWSEMSGEWKHVMYLEQLKLYELLISQSCQTEIIFFKPSLFQPLLYLLDALSTFLVSNYSNYVEIEKRLVILLNTLCVFINQNNRLINLFIFSNNKSLDDTHRVSNTAKTNGLNVTKESSPEKNICCDKFSEKVQIQEKREILEEKKNDFSFPIFSLLIKFVHRDGPIGQQSRDAILLCMSMFRYDEQMAHYIANKTDFCPVLATGLSGHFSSLPRVLIAQSMQSEHFQIKHQSTCGSQEIEHFLKCLDFCNAVVQISHPIIQVQLLKFIFNGFLIPVIGPALHQDVANVSLDDLETIPSYSNTLDVIITTTAYLDLFIRTISESKLIRIFLEFLCFEIYDNNYIITTLINRIEAKSKLSLITLIFFKTLIDLNCEDLLYELIFKHLLRGRHLQKKADYVSSDKKHSQSYQKNWLAISAQKLLSSTMSYYLSNLCSHHQSSRSNVESDTESVSSFDSYLSSCKCHSNYFFNYLDYLNDARTNIDQCLLSTKSWRNSYYEPCDLLNKVQDQSIIFCTIEQNVNNNHEENFNDHDEDILDVNEIINKNSIMSKLSPGFKMKNCYYDENLKKINYKIETNSLFETNIVKNNESPVGLFLSIIFIKFEKFFENDILTNLHLTGLLTRICHFPHKLLLSLLFDETLSRTENVPCFIHILQKLSLEAQNYCDEIPDFESVFHAAKINLQSMPIGELDCPLLMSNFRRKDDNVSLTKMEDSSSAVKQPYQNAYGLLKNLFFRSSPNKPSTLTRRFSNVSTVSSTGQMLEVVPGGVRFINQHFKHKENLSKENDGSVDIKFNELVYNLIIFDEFLMELSAILIEHSVREFCK